MLLDEFFGVEIPSRINAVTPPDRAERLASELEMEVRPIDPVTIPHGADLLPPLYELVFRYVDFVHMGIQGLDIFRLVGGPGIVNDFDDIPPPVAAILPHRLCKGHDAVSDAVNRVSQVAVSPLSMAAVPVLTEMMVPPERLNISIPFGIGRSHGIREAVADRAIAQQLCFG